MQANGMIFWDWNGTLMDDVDFTHSCLNWMLETHGYPQRYDLAAYREIFGFPIEEYYIRAGFNFAKHPYAELAERFMEHYNAGVDACPPSAHAAETLAELSRQGWRQSVLSASRRDYLIEQVRMYTATGQREYMDNYFEELNTTRRRETALEYFAEHYGDNDAFTLLKSAMTTSQNLSYTDRANPGESIFKDADEALYRVKQNGKHGCGFY